MQLIKTKGFFPGLFLILALGSSASLVCMHKGSEKDEKEEELKWDKTRQTGEPNAIGEELLAAIRRLDRAQALALLDQHPNLINYRSPIVDTERILYFIDPSRIQFLVDDTSTPLLAALGSTSEHLALMTDLLERDVDPLQPGSSNQLLPFIEAIHRCRLDVELIQFLANRGGDLINTPGRAGQTPLQFALQLGVATSFVEELLRLGAEVNAQDANGWAALHYLVHNPSPSSFETLILLLDHAADPNIAARDGRRPYEVSLVPDEHGSAELAARIIQARSSSHLTESLPEG